MSNLSLADLTATTCNKLTLESYCHIFIKLLRFYTRSPIITEESEVLPHKTESTIVYFLGLTTHYVRHPDYYLHRYKYCLRCGEFQRLVDPYCYVPNLLVPYCNNCCRLEGKTSKGKGHYHYIDCYNPMVTVYNALPLEYRSTIDKLIKDYYYKPVI